jgi:hypothetical protein
MEILKNLPDELKNKIFYYLSHPCADIIKQEIKTLNCDKIYKFKNNGKLFAVVDGRDFFINEYFKQFDYDSDDDDIFIEKMTDLLFNISSDTSSDEDSFNNN